VLLVDSDENDAELVRRTLRSKPGVKVAIASDGLAALELLRGEAFGDSRTRLPGAVFLELSLPKVSGLELLRQIRSHERMRWLPVIVLSSSKEDSDLLSCYQAGANSYIIKPLDFQQFKAVILELTQYWLQLNELVRG
jgi:two-component system response regulator